MIRGQKVIVDADLARLYGVSTKRLNESVKRNLLKFPTDFMFQISQQEKLEVVANCDHLKNLKYSPTLPYVFTEYSTLMAATVLNSQQATQMSIVIIRTFVKLRQLLHSNKVLSKRLDELEKSYDKKFSIVFQAIKQLMQTPEESKKSKIGFNTH